MVLDFREPANDANQQIAFIRPQLCARNQTTFFPVSVHAHVDAEWNHRELFGSTDAKFFVYLSTLLIAHYHNSICYQLRQRSLDCQKQARLPRAVIAVENVAVIGMDKET